LLKGDIEDIEEMKVKNMKRKADECVLEISDDESEQKRYISNFILLNKYLFSYFNQYN